MNKFIFTIGIVLILSATNLQAQQQDSLIFAKLQNLKDKMAAKGIEMTLLAPGEKEVKKEHPFIERHRNTSLPPFQLKDLSGTEISSDELKGKYVHINFWSVTCKPCIEEFPELDQIREKYGTEKVIYLAMAPEEIEKVNKVLRKHPLKYTVIPNAQEYFDQLGIDGYPKNFFITPNGKIMEVTNGTNYSITQVNGEAKLVPDNFRHYDKIMEDIIQD